MLKKIVYNFMKKSPKERFLLIIGILFFLVYLFMGLVVIFWDSIFPRSFPITMSSTYRMAFGIILIVYSFLRINRFLIANKD